MLKTDSGEASMSESQSDEVLMRLFQGGDEEAFKTLFDRYSARLINFAHRSFHNREEAEDVAQETLLRVYRGKDRYDASRPFRPWLYSIIARLVSNRLRDKKRHPCVSLDYQTEDGNGSVEPSELIEKRRVEDSCEKKEVADVVRQAFERLPENQRLAVTLAKYEEMPYHDIARIMEISLSAVESLLFRARQSLKKNLSPYVNPKNNAVKP